MATIVEKKETPLPIRKNALPRDFLIWHVVGLVLVGAIIVVLTAINFLPIINTPAEPESKLKLHPDFDYKLWRPLAAQHGGRIKPFETASQELCREIHGRNKVLGNDSVVVVLSWMLEGNPKAQERKGQWDDKDFILCEHQDVRKLIYMLQPDGSLKEHVPLPDENGKLVVRALGHDEIHGKYMSPNRLKEFREKWSNLEKTKAYRVKELSSNLPESEFGQIFHRLRLYESLRTPVTVLNQSDRVRDPLAFVALDKVPGAPWFTIGQLRLINQDPEQWYKQVKERVKDVPHLYLSADHQKELEKFQQRLLAGQGEQAVTELKDDISSRSSKFVDAYVSLRKEKKEDSDREAALLIATELATWPYVKDAEKEGKAEQDNQKLINHLLAIVSSKDDEVNHNVVEFIQTGNRSRMVDALLLAKGDPQAVADGFAAFLNDRDERLIEDLQKRLPRPGEYLPTHQKYRMLHLGYLETRYPDMYDMAMKWQEPPLAEIKTVLASFDALSNAYDSGDAGKFAKASEEFFTTVEDVSKKSTKAYPGVDSIGDRLGHLVSGENINTPSASLIEMELTFNRVKPFMWAWILMLGSLLFFVLSLGLNSRVCYIAGFSLYALSLAIQVYGFFVRVVISGRPPVSNIYETVIWVAFMTGVFALILETIYRRKVIALAGAMVATLGLVLADQLPLALDPKINPLVPVLRSNFWLTIHVITIVSSYAGGALAWGLGNIALILILFRSSNKETIKILSNFTYRALQIAVLLLAAGTFLGGWWAAYSWGRFWGWDPKETGALIALVCYVIPLHMRYAGWIKDFGLAVAAIFCFAAIMISWYGVNFIFPAGLHAYGFGAGGATWVYWAAFLNIQWVLVASLIYKYKLMQPQAQVAM